MRINALRNTVCAVALFGVPLAFLLLVTHTTHAQEQQESVITKTVEPAFEAASTPFSVTPVVANEKAKPRDIIKKELLITNNTQERLDLYISVENIDPTDGAQEFVSPSASDLSTSLANWIEITRGVIELTAGESRKIPYLIHVNLTAKPGSYFARIQFRDGAKRSDAEAKEDGTSLMLNVEVLDDAKERLQLGNFTSSDSLVLGDEVDFSYLLENVGNRLIEPRGSIRIFNRRGEEVGSVPLNAEGEEITPDNKKQLAAAWSAAGRFGKYKAFLDLEYGENQVASVQDTVYFWVFPWKEIFASLMGVLVLAVMGTYIVHMRLVARPAPHRVASEPATGGPTYGREPAVSVSMPSARASAASRHEPQQGGPTVLATRSQSVPRHTEPTTMTTPRTRISASANNGAQVHLAPHHGRMSAQKHGNIVELTARR